MSTYFKYPQEIKTLIYTMNTIEEYSRQLRIIMKNKSVFFTDDILLKMLYLAIQNITKNRQVVKEISGKSYLSFKYILKEEFKFKCTKV